MTANILSDILTDNEESFGNTMSISETGLHLVI